MTLTGASILAKIVCMKITIGRLVAITVAIVFALIGQAIGSDAPIAGPLLILGSLAVGAFFGAITALGHVGGRTDWSFRIGTVAILFLGGIAVFTPTAKAMLIVPSASMGALTGFFSLVMALSMPSGDDE